MIQNTPDALAAAGLIRDADGRQCCYWQPSLPHYHDCEWGMPVMDDRRLFEKVCLEGFHAGMSWKLIYHKRDNFRRAFHDFDFYQVARFTDDDVVRLLQDPGIVRNRVKIQSAINNAQRAIALVEEAGSLARWFWQFEPAPQSRPERVDLAWWQKTKTTAEAVQMSQALKTRGWSWVGPVTTWALMQALGMVNDHLEGCHRREACEQARASLSRPG